MSYKPTKVLLIEDDQGDAVFLRKLLSKEPFHSFRVVWVERLSDGLNKIKEEKFDVVLLDLILPDEAGIKTFKAIHSIAPDLPIVILTGLDDNDAATAAVRLGAQDYLPKQDLNVRLITRTIRHAIERQKLVLELKEALENVKTLSGLLPICASCKKIRDDKGYWEQVETYIAQRSNALFTHSICPDCVQKYYPEYADSVLNTNSKISTDVNGS